MTITREDLDAGRIDLSDLIDPDAEPLGPITPGVILREEFMAPLGLTAYALAKALAVPRNRITAILNGERAITAETAMRLGRYFGTSAELWLGLRHDYELRRARREHGVRVEREVSPRAPGDGEGAEGRPAHAA